MNIVDIENKKTLFNHMMYCQEQLNKAREENGKWNGFYSTQYELIKECQSKGYSYLQFDALKRKAWAEVNFWEKEYDKALQNFNEKFSSWGDATLFMLIYCSEDKEGTEVPKKPCIGCVYYDVCGSTTRTEPCAGRKTKREQKASTGGK